MIKIVLSYLITALIPVLIIVFSIFFYRLAYRRKMVRKYWERQSLDSLKAVNPVGAEQFPDSPLILREKDCIVTGLQATALIQELGLIEKFLKENVLSEGEIAKFLSIPKEVCSALLGVLVASGVLCHLDEGYILTDSGKLYMNPNSPFFIPLPEPSLARHLFRQVRRGKRDATTDYWKEGKSQLPEEWAMQQHIYSFPLGFAMHDKGYFKNVRRILDVAGGAGSICIAIALNNPDIEIDMIELPRSVKTAQCMIARYDQSERIHTYGLIMFGADWPRGYDAVLFTNIYHDWKLEDCYQLTTKTHQSLKPGGKILIQEALIDEDRSGPLWIMHWSLAMILFTQGRQIKGSQVKNILEDCGFNDVTIGPVYNYYSTVSAFKPE